MNYTDLKTNIQDICENTFTDAQLAMFTEQAEQKIYSTVQIPALRRNVTSLISTGVKYVALPSDYLYTYSIAVLDGTVYTYLLNRDVNYIREMYPNSTVTGTPKYYAFFDDKSLLVGPATDKQYTVELHYGYYPESIVTAGSTWLGNEFDSALLNGALVEAIRFLKGEQDMVALYNKMFLDALGLLKMLGDGKDRQDAYQSGQIRVPVQ